MCGIAGAAWTSDATPLERATLERMTTLLRHRGPDDAGYHHDQGDWGGVALGHRRLSIIDLAGGHQPLANEDESIWTVFNGEIYNYQDLRRDLEGRGHRFRTRSDTEVLVHLYEDFGAACVEHLRGMFALAIWDARKKQLFLARDRLGQKPLVYREEAGRLVFASELKAILAVPGMPREMDPVALDEYLLYQYVPHPRTIFRGVSKLPPAHYAVYRGGRLEIAPYWQPEFNAERRRPVAEYRERLRETLTEATRLRMISEVPLGSFLSGGVDSTIITGLMQQVAGEPVKTYSIGFPVAGYDETAYAREAAGFLGTDHHEFCVEPDSIDLLPKLVWHYDEPFGDSSAIPTYYVSQYSRREVTVAVTGDAGDELFFGYPRYQAVWLAGRIDRLPKPLRLAAAARLWQRLPASPDQKSPIRRMKKLLAALGEPPERRYLRWVGLFDDARRRALYSDGFRESLDGHDAARFVLDAYARCRQRDFLSQTTFVDLLTYLPGALLAKVDIASMAHGLECRSPLLDHHVVELAIAMPMALKQQGMTGKRIFKETFADLLPPSIRQRRKMGFGVPLDAWFRGQLRRHLTEVLLDPVSLGRGYFRPEVVQRMVREHVEGRWDHSYRLWALLWFEHWHRMFLDHGNADLIS